MSRLISFALLVTGVVHLLPAIGVAGAPRLFALYGVSVVDPQLLLLIRHRALMLGVLGALMVAAAFTPALRGFMLAAALLCTLGFVVLARHEPLLGPLRRVMWIDVGVAALLAVAGVALILERSVPRDAHAQTAAEE